MDAIKNSAQPRKGGGARYQVKALYAGQDKPGAVQVIMIGQPKRPTGRHQELPHLV